MRIGFVSTWLHRGGTYVTINYAKLLMPENEIFVYARAGEFFDESLQVENVKVYRAPRIGHKTEVLYSDFRKWIRINDIDIVIWNEQREFETIVLAKEEFPQIAHGAYIDYYKEDTIEDFGVFDFLICNTRRHFSVFSWHPQAFYLPWGCDVDLYVPSKKKADDESKIVFFHSMGMSDRKGTDVLVKVFSENKLSNYGAKLIIHSQVNIDHLISKEEAEKSNIEIINETVGAPGLYHLGDVYVYPAKLDGLGLTLYEAIACGLPTIATDVAPMNEVINDKCGKLINVERLFSRSDGYYWPQANISEQSLLNCMLYYINHYEELPLLSKQVRQYAVDNWNLAKRKELLLNFIKQVTVIDNSMVQKKYMKKAKNLLHVEKRQAFIKLFVPSKFMAGIKFVREKAAIKQRRG